MLQCAALLLLLTPGPRVSAQQNTAIDFSGGVEQSDGSVCVVREEEQDRVEQGKEEQCTQQMVNQCYNSYVTTYKDVVRERCQEVFIKTCRIILRERAFNATTRVCKRPLIKECNDPVPVLPSYGGYGAPPPPVNQPEPNIVCRNLYETVCNTTHQVPLTGGPSLPVTSCDQVKRKICAEDHCRVVEGEEECHDKVVASAVEVPEETCSMAPEEECKNVTTSVPQLLPEQECRLIPKEVCQTVFLNPRNVKATVPVRYCTNPDTGVIQQQDQEDFSLPLDPRRAPFDIMESERLRTPRTELQQQGGQGQLNQRSNKERLLQGRINRNRNTLF